VINNCYPLWNRPIINLWIYCIICFFILFFIFYFCTFKCINFSKLFTCFWNDINVLDKIVEGIITTITSGVGNNKSFYFGKLEVNIINFKY